MKMNVFFILLSVFSIGLGACKSGIQNLMPEIKDADSATIIYYKKPPDNRFFKVVKAKNATDLETVIQDVNASAQKQTTASCESIGKIYFYKGSEQVYVVYFSDESCRKLAFIKNGERYEAEMGQSSFQILNKWKENAVEPDKR